MLFYLEIIKRGEFTNLSKFVEDNDLVCSYSFQKPTVRLFIYNYIIHREARIIEDENKILFVHGQSSNVTLHNYTELDILKGNFNLIAISKNGDKVEFIKDFTNSFDSFIYEDENRIVISNNPLWIKPQEISLDYQSISQYLLTVQGVFPDSYFIKEIRKLSPALHLIIRDGEIVEQRSIKSKMREVSYKSFFDSFNDIVKSCLNNGDGIDLTGGYDSRLVMASARYNKFETTGVVHGENDKEVKFVKRFSKKINIPLISLEINDDIEDVLANWKQYYFLSGGYYNLFETLKEGARSVKRRTLINSKVGGSMGEVLRDKWYVSKISRKNLITRKTLKKQILKKLINTKEIYNFCTESFKASLNKYNVNLSQNIKKCSDEYSASDLTQIYMRIVFENYTRGWNGCLYNYHNNIIRVIAPFMDNQFYIKCLNVDSDFRKYSSGISKALNTYSPEFKKIPFIDGQHSKPIVGINLIRYLICHYFQEFNTRILNKPQKKDYNHSEWLRLLMIDPEFSEILGRDLNGFNSIVKKNVFDKLTMDGLNNNLDSKEFILLWKLVSLKLTLINFY